MSRSSTSIAPLRVDPRVPALKPRRVSRTFRNAGYILDHVEGSHYYFTYPTDRSVHFSVPDHSRDIKRSTLAKILKQARISLDEFLRHDP
ncbi:MAG: type II toxin-antitoxin system HicA family toxin [Candidatus Rokubacteria bacterium]|nr:type II toxin-antitoxin system HicA family toxin [Candidatus Rokubacteria bacterium]